MRFIVQMVVCVTILSTVETIDPALAALGLTYSALAMPWLAYTVMVGTMVETKMNSAERLINYWSVLPSLQFLSVCLETDFTTLLFVFFVFFVFFCFFFCFFCFCREDTPAEDLKLDMGVVDDSGPPKVADSAYGKAEASLPRVWPSHGAVTFKEYSMRYRPEMPLVLKSLSCSIVAGEKVGVVGRTGERGVDYRRLFPHRLHCTR